MRKGKYIDLAGAELKDVTEMGFAIEVFKSRALPSSR